MEKQSNKPNKFSNQLKLVHKPHWAGSKWFVILVTSLVALGTGTSAGAWSQSVSQDQTVLPRVSVGGVDVSGLNQSDARDLIKTAVDTFLAEPFVFLGTSQEGVSKRFELSAEELGLLIDVEASAAQAFALGHDSNRFKNVADQVSVAFGGGALPLQAGYDPDILDNAFETAFLSIEHPAKDARLSLNEGEIQELPPELGNEIIRGPVSEQLDTVARMLDHRDVTLALGPTEPEAQLEDLVDSKRLAEQILGSGLNFYYGDKNYSPSRDELGAWLEFVTIKPIEVQGKDACACGLPKPKPKKGQSLEADTAELPSITVTPFDQKRRGDQATDPYTLLLPPQNYGSFVSGDLPKHMPVVGINREKLSHWLLETAAADLDVAGENARLAFEDNQVKVTKPSKAGTGVDISAAVSEMLFAVATPEPHVRLNLVEKKPAINEEIIDELGITTLIASGWSDSTNSSGNRIHNINRGFELLSGLVIAPGEEFSTIKSIAPIDGYNGYVPELVITGNKLRPEYGGGLCQVGSTLFRAAMDAGLEITERANHAFEVGHYLAPYPDFGVEATLYDDHPDLRFINDTGGHILINAYLDDELGAHVDFYGTDSGRTTTIDGPYRISGSPYAGGSTVFTYTVRDDATGEVIREVEFFSSFQPAAKFKLEGSEDD